MKYVLGIFFLILQLYGTSNVIHPSSAVFSIKNTQHGLSDNWVRSIYQDSRGFMWFGTASGLNRYDGVEFRHYPFNYSNINQISYFDAEHMLVCTDLGAYTFNIYSQNIEFIPIQHSHPVLCAVIQQDSLIWFGTSAGLVRYNIHTKSRTIYTHNQHNENSLSHNYINTLILDEHDNLLLGTKNGLSIYTHEGSFLRYSMKNLANLQNNDILALALDVKNRLWVGAARGGVTVYSSSNLSENTLQSQKIVGGNIISICIDSRNYAWIGCGSGEGLYVVDAHTLSYTEHPHITHIKKNPFVRNTISDNSIFTVYEDSTGDIWIGTFGGGVNYVSQRAKNFRVIDEFQAQEKILSSNLINCFLEDGDLLWVGTESGLDCWNKTTNTWTSYNNIPGDSRSLQGSAVYSLYKCSFGNIWIGTWSGGLQTFDYKTQTFTHIALNENPTNNVFAIAEDKNANIWIGTVDPNDGLYKYSISSGEIVEYSSKNQPNSLSLNSINDILVSESGTVYISTFHGVDIYQPESDDFLFVSLADFSVEPNIVPYVSGLYEHSRNEILATTNYGLLTINKTTTRFESLPYSHLYSNIIQGIIEDSRNNIWLSTLQGLYRISKKNKSEYTVEQFTHHDGISGNETKARSIYRTSQGYIFVGTSQGITYFHEDSIFKNTLIPPIVITNMLLLQNVPHANAQYVPLTGYSFEQDTVILDYTASDFMIRFAALNYVIPQKNRYSYKLVGHDLEWIDGGSNTSVSYTNMQPGTYTFMVIGSNNDGVWNTTPKTLTIIITPPWWQTLPIRILSIFLILLGIWGLIAMRLRMYAKQQKILTQKVEERTQELVQINAVLQEKQHEISKQNEELFTHRNKLQELVDERTVDLLIAKQKAEESDTLKSAFLSNMSHEIRTPMNGIVGFSEMLISESLTEDEKMEYAKVISESSKQLLRIVDDILDISRIETGNVTVNNDTVDVHEFMKDIRSFFEPQARAKNISYQQEIPKENLYIKTDKTKVFQVLSNLLHNALKFTEQGEIHCGIVVQAHNLLLYVKDTGIGIPKQLHNKIFERFRQAEMSISRTYGGTGLGLAISKKLVELMQGEIWLESEPGIGSSFYVSLPYTLSQEEQETPVFRSRIAFSKKQKTILIAEDNDVNYYYLEQLLTRAKLTVIRAKDGKQAIEICAREPISLVLMDIKMPKLDGISAAKEILALKPKLPILFQTAFVFTFNTKQALEIDCVGLISKPIRKEELFQYLSKYI